MAWADDISLVDLRLDLLRGLCVPINVSVIFAARWATFFVIEAVRSTPFSCCVMLCGVVICVPLYCCNTFLIAGINSLFESLQENIFWSYNPIPAAFCGRIMTWLIECGGLILRVSMLLASRVAKSACGLCRDSTVRPKQLLSFIVRDPHKHNPFCDTMPTNPSHLSLADKIHIVCTRARNVWGTQLLAPDVQCRMAFVGG